MLKADQKHFTFRLFWFYSSTVTARAKTFLKLSGDTASQTLENQMMYVFAHFSNFFVTAEIFNHPSRKPKTEYRKITSCKNLTTQPQLQECDFQCQVKKHYNTLHYYVLQLWQVIFFIFRGAILVKCFQRKNSSP